MIKNLCELSHPRLRPAPSKLWKSSENGFGSPTRVSSTPSDVAMATLYSSPPHDFAVCDMIRAAASTGAAMPIKLVFERVSFKALARIDNGQENGPKCF